MLLPLLGTPFFASAQKEQDVFADFAHMKREKVPGLQKNTAPVLPKLLLPWDANPGAAFDAGEAIQTQQQLDAELLNMRKQYVPFLANLAPALPDFHKRVMLTSFQWKLLATEMTVDARENLYPLPAVRNVADSTSWKTVIIPHYEGPINKAEATIPI